MNERRKKFNRKVGHLTFLVNSKTTRSDGTKVGFSGSFEVELSRAAACGRRLVSSPASRQLGSRVFRCKRSLAIDG